MKVLLAIIRLFLYDDVMKKAKIRLLHLIIAAVAVINLGLLFFFQYGLSNATHAVKAANRAAEERAAYDIESGFADRVASETNAIIVTSGITTENAEEALPEEAIITEDEEAALEEMSDNSDVTGADNKTAANKTEEEAASETKEKSDDSETEEKSDVSETEENSEESNKSDENASGTPVITLSSDLPEIDLDKLDNIAATLHDLGLLSADDGYGKDISDQITVKYEPVSDDSMEFHVVFSVTNQAGEKVSEECNITGKIGDHPVLILTSEKITLSQYDEFNYLNYILIARDTDGSSLSDLISLSGYVDTDTPGTYEVTYSTISQVSFERIDKTLTVVVEE